MKGGLFVVVDGLDGSGKSEVVKMLHNYLFSKSKKYRILTTREPTNGVFGKQIREMLRTEADPSANSKTILELFINDRKEHLKNIIGPFLKNTGAEEINIVLCDRYYYSTIAFQGAQGLDIKMLIERNGRFMKPDIAFILDVEPALALKRIEYRKKEKFEKLEFMKKIRENFLCLPKMLPDNIQIINSSKSLKEVFEDIKKEVVAILKKDTAED